MSRHMERALALIALLAVASPAARSQDLLWSNNYGGPYHEFGHACQQTTEGDYLLLGSTYSYGSGSFDIYLVRVDTLGNKVSSATFGGALTEYGYDLHRTSDGGFVIVGSTKSFGAGEKDVYLIRLNASGQPIWSKTFGGPLDDEGRSVRQTADNGFIICGGTFSSGAGYQDVFLIKTDANGNLSWQRTYGGAGGESGSAVRQTADGGYIVVGSTGSFGEGYSSIYVVRTNQNGDSLWATTYGGPRADYGYTVEIARDGGFVFAGATASYGAGSNDAYLIKTDPLGTVEWDRTYGGSDDDRVYSIVETGAGNFILGGNTLSFSSSFNIYIVKADPNGNLIWDQDYGGSESDYCERVFSDMRGNLVVVGRSFSYSAGGSDMYVLKIGGDVQTDVMEPIPGMLPEEFQLAQNYPNPFNMSTVIEFSLLRRSQVSLTIYNILGQKIRQWDAESLPAGSYRYEWDGTSDCGGDIASGVYLYNLRTETFSRTKKMILLK
ncbi:MAG: T9SS type A sorting domain-containing protein [Candidatus Zixiibacteriota bacterium]|nr:MAG: T9SS type A sorting domain-containing protein [candidate division Zixibacteria bacterium]